MIDEYRLVYRADSLVNWCPGLGTVLANEEVTADGRSDRGNFPVFRKRLRQWMMRITAYADRLLDDLDVLDWPEQVKTMQRNWIGRSTGAVALFSARAASDDGFEVDIEVFTTRPDTLFGATYLVLAPEHDLVDELVAASWPAGVNPLWTYGGGTPGEAIAAYRRAIAAKSDLERQESGEKTGVFLGSYAINPANGEPVPIFIADYVLAGYGTGAIMAVPGHDQRDWDFARAFGLPIVGSNCRRQYFGIRVYRRWHPGQLGLPQWNERASSKAGHRRPVGVRGPRPGSNRIQIARLAFCAAAVLG